jgi:hypothetical protein
MCDKNQRCALHWEDDRSLVQAPPILLQFQLRQPALDRRHVRVRLPYRFNDLFNWFVLHISRCDYVFEGVNTWSVSARVFTQGFRLTIDQAFGDLSGTLLDDVHFRMSFNDSPGWNHVECNIPILYMGICTLRDAGVQLIHNCAQLEDIDAIKTRCINLKDFPISSSFPRPLDRPISCMIPIWEEGNERRAPVACAPGKVPFNIVFQSLLRVALDRRFVPGCLIAGK